MDSELVHKIFMINFLIHVQYIYHTEHLNDDFVKFLTDTLIEDFEGKQFSSKQNDKLFELKLCSLELVNLQIT